METCAECQNLLWEELFGLLEASASDNLRRHLATCAACQTEMIKAEADQRLLASVARLDVDIPLFTLPAAETIPIAQANEPEGLPALRRSRLWPWLAAAAAVLVCLALPYGLYKRGLSQREFALRQSGEEVEQIDAKQQDLIKAAEGELFAQQAENRQKHMRLQVLGPATYQPGLVSQYRILATDLDGEPRQVELSARLHDGDKRLLFEKSIAGKGELTVSLPPGLIAPGRNRADLEIIAKNSADTVHVREQIHVRDARFITHLTTDRTVYHPGEPVFFRSLTLEPFDLRPSGRDFQVAYTLMDPRSARIKPMTGHTRSDGIGGGSFELSASAMPGKYRLTVTDLGGNRFMPVTRTIMVRPRKADEKTGTKGPAQATPQALNVEFLPEG